MRTKPPFSRSQGPVKNVRRNWSFSMEALPQVMPPLPDIEEPYSEGVQRKGYYNLIKYFGGKFHQLSKTLPYIELIGMKNSAHTYVECFGGGGKCVLNIETIHNTFSKKIYNEWDGGMCSLFKVASSPELTEQLVKKLRRTSYSEEVFKKALEDKNNSDIELSLIDKAAATFILCSMSFNCNQKSFRKPDNNEWNKLYRNAIENILLAPEHLCNVEVINGDYRALLKKYGADKRVVKYLDPPYHPACRNQNALKVYPNELSREQHQEMVKILCKSRSWVLSGYDPAQFGCDDYKPLEASGAIKESIGDFVLSSSNNKILKEEFIWYKL